MGRAILSTSPKVGSSLETLDWLMLTRYPQHLALDMLIGCGMMPRSEKAIAYRTGSVGRSSSLVTARALNSSPAAAFPKSLPKEISAFSLLYQRKIKSPLVNLFDGTLRLNERLGCHDPFIEWAR